MVWPALKDVRLVYGTVCCYGEDGDGDEEVLVLLRGRETEDVDVDTIKMPCGEMTVIMAGEIKK